MNFADSQQLLGEVKRPSKLGETEQTRQKALDEILDRIATGDLRLFEALSRYFSTKVESSLSKAA